MRARSSPVLLLVLLSTGFATGLLFPRPWPAFPPPSHAAATATTVAPETTTPFAAASPTPPPATPTPPATATPTATPSARPTDVPAPTTTPTKLRVVSRALFVDQDAQVMHVYENGVQVRTLPCSTGLPVPGKQTPGWTGLVGHYVGTFFAFGVYADEAWYLFEYDGAILVHSAPYTLQEGKKVYQELDELGRRPVSHGCIRLLPEDARWLSEWNPQGVPIAISPLTRKE